MGLDSSSLPNYVAIMSLSNNKRSSTPKFKSGEKDTTPGEIDSKLTENCRLKARVWVEKGGETFLSYARITILERIQGFGSITKAAKSMGISYRHAWKLVGAMNRLSAEPMIETQTGGRGGGGAKLTETGENAIKVFWLVQTHLKSYLTQLNQDLKI